MQTKTIAIAGSASRYLSLKARFSQLKKWLLPAALFLSLAFFAAPASGQQISYDPAPGQMYEDYTSSRTVVFDITGDAGTGFTAANFSLSTNIPGAAISSV